MAIKIIVCSADGRPIEVNTHGELVVGKTDHSTPYSASRSTAGVSNIVNLKTNFRFIITYLVVASDKTNVESQVYVYETKTIDGDYTTAENFILRGGMVRNDRIILSDLDLKTLPSRFVNIETDNTALIDITIMGYYEQEV